jgi:ABC-type lipoprotein export system ATPase subunit
MRDRETPGGDGKLISLRGVFKTYHTPAGDFPALRGVDLDVGYGEFVAVIGKSGSGKSTLLNVITGIDRPSYGEVWVDGTGVHGLSESKLAVWRGKSLGIVFQFFQLLPTLSVIENVMLPMDFSGVIPARERHSRALELLKAVDMAEEADVLPSALAGGQQQRVAIARALANDPPLLVADEPTGNLDSKSAENVFDLFERLVAGGKTILMVTHDRDLARRVHRTVIISDGEIIEEVVARALPALTEGQLVNVTRELGRRQLEPGEVLIAEGTAPRAFYIVTDGIVEVNVRARNGEEMVVAQMRPGMFVGEIELLRGLESVATVRASLAEPAEVVAIEREDFEALLAESEATRQALAAVAAERMQENTAARGDTGDGARSAERSPL